LDNNDMSQTLPGLMPVRSMLEDLLGREVMLTPSDPVSAADLPTMAVALYVDGAGRLAAVIGMDLTLAANAGAALGLLPAGAAEDSIEDKQLSPMLRENVQELYNILTGLLNKEGEPHLTLYRVVAPGEALPSDAAAHLLAIRNRLDVKVEISRYGGGLLALVLTA
jgi:hypothetical protein